MTERERDGEIRRLVMSERITPKQVADLIRLQDREQLPDGIIRAMIRKIMETEGGKNWTVEEMWNSGEWQAVEDRALELAVRSALRRNPEAVERIRDGHDEAVGPVMGFVAKLTDGKADMAKAKEMALRFVQNEDFVP